MFSEGPMLSRFAPVLVLFAGLSSSLPTMSADYDLGLSDVHAIWVQINRALSDILDSGVLPPLAHPPSQTNGKGFDPNDVEKLEGELFRVHWLIDSLLDKQGCLSLVDHDHPSAPNDPLEHLYLESGEILDSLVACVEVSRSGSRPLTPYYANVSGFDPGVSDILRLVEVASVKASGYVDQGRSSALGDSTP